MSDESRLAEDKLIILYLLKKMKISLSNNEISQFALEGNIMDYFAVQQYLSELVESEFIESYSENNSTRYLITNEGNNALEFFENRISEWLKTSANEYIINNSKRIRSEYETSANYFLDSNGDYLVKCAVCSISGSKIMEVNVTVATKSQANIICTNWKKNVSSIVGNIFTNLIGDES